MTGQDDALNALTDGRWADAEAAIAGQPPTPDGMEILAEARWWLGQVDAAIAAWIDAHELSREAGDRERAERLAAWVSREYSALGNDGAAAGWRARAEPQAGREPNGWVALASAALARDPAEQGDLARRALDAGRATHDRDLEIMALARVGLARIRSGSFGDGLACFDEAMAAATAGSARRLRTVGEVCCDLVLATELTGDVQRFSRWLGIVEDFVDRRGYPPVMGFCATCCAEAEATQGDFGGAEQQLRAAVVSLHETGHAPRCVPPTAKLAELLVLQGRLEEAEQILGDYESEDALLARSRLALTRGDATLAATLATRSSRRLGGDTLVKIAALALLVDAHLALGDRTAAEQASSRLDGLAAGASSARADARAAIARGRLVVEDGNREAAILCFEDALDRVAGVQGSIEGAEAHLDLARLHTDTAPDVARAEARAALAAFESIGATNGTDEAAALLRALGDRSRVGPKGVGLLTQREYEVLRLVAQGLTNAELGERLFISTKTAGNHVSSILSKLNLRSRAEAAAYATLHPTR